MTIDQRLDHIGELLEGLSTNVEILTKDVEGLKQDFEGLKQDVGILKQDVEGLKQETTRTNDKVEIYQKASQQIVNLAFGLLLTASLAIIIPAVLNR
jgi:uncharacterized protein YoxC